MSARNYRRSTSVPLTLGSMLGMMTQPPKPVLDPVTVAGQKAYKIYTDLKWCVSISDGNVETIRGLINAAIERSKTEIVHEGTRLKTVQQFEAMLATIAPSEAGPAEA